MGDKIMKNYLFLFFALFLVQCSINRNIAESPSKNFKRDTLTYFDSARNRKIPVAIYQPKNKNLANHIPVIFSHGWGENKGGDYFRYDYLTESLASQGYFVMSIQHELPTDEMLAMDGNLQVMRRPNWERGAKNIYFVLNKMKADFPTLNYKKLALIGHSNGGDMTVLFAHEHPELADKIISMDNRRMPLPRTSHPKIFTIRSNDYPADEGVLPTEEEQKKYGISVEFSKLNHSNMDNDANAEERKYMTEKILGYLKQ